MGAYRFALRHACVAGDNSRMEPNPYGSPSVISQPSSAQKLSRAAWLGLIVLAYVVFATAMELLKPWLLRDDFRP
jgi:hypothetical protein